VATIATNAPNRLDPKRCAITSVIEIRLWRFA
jgi:hypothetical protein